VRLRVVIQRLIDLHVHTTASDGALSPSDIVLQARAAGLSHFSITDHDTVAGLEAGGDAARTAGLTLIAGIEISSVADGRDVHVLGYFFDPGAACLHRFLGQQREERLRRVREMGARLAALGVPIDVAPILADADRGKSVGRPQVATALQSAGHVATRDEAFRRFLESGAPAFVPRCGATPAEVIAIVHDAGGIASLAHPGLTRRDDLIPSLAGAGLDAIEVRHPDHDAATEARYRALAHELGVLVSGGSDFHGDTGYRVPKLGIVTLDSADYDRLREKARRQPAE
jgi:3',5'-nucleoside bisphosphate phosphatase